MRTYLLSAAERCLRSNAEEKKRRNIRDDRQGGLGTIGAIVTTRGWLMFSLDGVRNGYEPARLVDLDKYIHRGALGRLVSIVPDHREQPQRGAR